MDKVKQFMEYSFPKLGDEYITITRIDNGGIVQERHYNNIDEAILYTTGIDKHYWNTYFSVTTTNGIGRTTRDLRTRSCICLDFDKSELGDGFNHIDILHKFKSIRCFYHAIVDTGHGYHVYIFIEPTTDLEAVEQVTKALAILTGADTKATLKTQLMRVPGTVNIKDEGRKNHKYVKIVYLADNDKVKRLPISKYQYDYVTERTKQTNINYVMRDDHTPRCVVNILENGSSIGDRNANLQTLVVALKRQGRSLAEVRAVVDEWLANTEAMSDLEYQIKYMYNNLYNGTLNCRECPHKGECYAVDDGYIDNNPKFEIPNRELKAITNNRSTRKGAKFMNGNMLVIYGVLANHTKGLYRNELIDELTYKGENGDLDGKCCFSDRTLKQTIEQLQDKGLIDVTTIDRKKFYKLRPNRVADNMKVKVSSAAVYECIKGNISPTELELYCYMKYLNYIKPKKRGDIPRAITVTQDELARDLGMTQQCISKMIQKLLNEKYISINYRAVSKSNGFKYNSYLLNY